jgi:hypothetical protein
MATTSYRNFLLQEYQCLHINPCGFFLWGLFKEKLFLRKPGALLELKGSIQPTLLTISEVLWAKLFAIARVLLVWVLRQNVGNNEHTVHWKQLSIHLRYRGSLMCNVFLQNIEAKQHLSAATYHALL